MKQKKIILVATLLLSVVTATAQSLNSAYFTDGYNFRHTMNPAYGNNQDYVSIPALGNINVRTQGNFGYDAIIKNNPNPYGNKTMTTFLNPYIDASTALEDFASGNNRVIGNVGITILSAGFKAWGGYNTIEINSKTSFGVSLPYELFEFAKNTGNKNYDIGDINAGALSYVEIAFGHSRQLTDQLRAGAKLKVLLGVGRADVKMEDVKAQLTDANQWLISANAQADVSLKGFTYKQKDKEYKQKPGTYKYVNDVDVDGAGVGGFGLGIDLGATYKLNDDWNFSAALLDLGFISWSNDMQARNMSKEFVFDGFHDVDVTRHGGMRDASDKYSDQLAEFANLQDQGDQGGRTTGIGTTLNVGAEYTLPMYRQLSFGLLSSTRFQGEYSWTEARLSANWEPLNWLDGGMSLGVGSFGASAGWLVNIHPKGFNFFIGMDHILGKQSKEFIPLSSKASINLGMNITW
ncbi:MAG: hypothetical protein IJ929_04895 [Prevotella sp.]|nr:hypothetical protein [Prevotella sp.]